MAGLEKCSYVTTKCTDKELISGFSQFYEDVKSALMDQQVIRFGWTPITTEHTLCKLA
jgi:hypothetical protein